MYPDDHHIIQEHLKKEGTYRCLMTNAELAKNLREALAEDAGGQEGAAARESFQSAHESPAVPAPGQRAVADLESGEGAALEAANSPAIPERGLDAQFRKSLQNSKRFQRSVTEGATRGTPARSGQFDTPGPNTVRRGKAPHDPPGQGHRVPDWSSGVIGSMDLDVYRKTVTELRQANALDPNRHMRAYSTEAVNISGGVLHLPVDDIIARERELQEQQEAAGDAGLAFRRRHRRGARGLQTIPSAQNTPRGTHGGEGSPGDQAGGQ